MRPTFLRINRVPSPAYSSQSSGFVQTLAGVGLNESEDARGGF
jgi:hypothetical protein